MCVGRSIQELPCQHALMYVSGVAAVQRLQKMEKCPAGELNLSGMAGVKDLYTKYTKNEMIKGLILFFLEIRLGT